MKLTSLHEAKYYKRPNYFSVTVGEIPDHRYGFIIEFLVGAETAEEAQGVVEPEYPGASFDVEFVDDDYLAEYGYENFEEFVDSIGDGAKAPKRGEFIYVMSGT